LKRWAAVAWKPALLLVGLAALGLGLRQVGFDPRAAVDAAGRQGPAGFVVIGMLVCAAGLPRQIVALAGGYAFGFWPGCALALAAELGGCAIDFYWARLLGRDAAAAFLRRRQSGRLHRLDRFLAGRAFAATLSLRLLPIGNNLVLNLLAGVSGIPAAPFLLASMVGYVPQTVVFGLAGAGASVSDGAQLALALGLFAVSIAFGVLLLRRGAHAA
jgi:uncharacterized membrane protein YdjX (TVP38/TMEM64 family)